MQESDVYAMLGELAERLPKFPDGRIDYTTSDIAPVVAVFVRCGDEFLLLKRSQEVSSYKGVWSTVAGYMDEPKPIRQKALEEMSEELGIGESEIESVKVGEPYLYEDTRIGKKWLRCLVLVTLRSKPKITLDFEHTESRWVRKEEIRGMDAVPGFYEDLEKVS